MNQSDNSIVLAALVKLSDFPSDENRIAFYRSLLQGSLLVAVASLPKEIIDTPQVLQESLSVNMLTSSGPNGGEVLLAFTDTQALRARVSAGFPLAMPSKQVLEIVLRDGYEGLVINPAGSWAEIPREDVERIVMDDL